MSTVERTGALDRPVWRLLAGLLLAAGALFLAWALIRGMAEALALGIDVRLPWLVAALVVGVLYVLLGGLAWWVVVRALLEAKGVTAPPFLQLLPLFVVGNLGRYAPGTVWFLATRAYLATRIGLPTGVVAVSLAMELLLIVLAGLLMTSVGLLAIPALENLRPFALLTASIPMVIAGLPGAIHPVVRRLAPGSPEPPLLPIASRLGLLGTYTGVWLVGAVTLWLVVQSVEQAPLTSFPQVAGAWGIGFLAGFLVPFLPAGLGVREGALVWLLTSPAGLAPAVATTVLFRLVLTVAEVCCLLVCAPAAGVMIERR